VPAFNIGAAWSMPIPTTIITITAIAMSVWILRTYHKKEINTLIASIFLAGIRGNMIDRIFYPGVRDFIFIGDRFPIFNVADIYLTIGVILIIRHEYREKTKKQ
jgi:signal peptidase II